MATLQPGEKARMFALGGIMRGGASRGGYIDNRIYIDIDGDQIGSVPDEAGRGVLLGTLTISDVLDETPNTCSFRVNGYVPEDGAELVITRGSKNAAPLFAGYALTVQQLYAGVPRNVQADVRAVDYTWLLAMQKITGQYRNSSATDTIKDLIAKFAAVNGFTTVHVAAGLPVLDVITFTDEDLPDAITRTCRRIGAYWYVDYRKDVHVFFEDTSRQPPAPLTPTHTSLTNFTRLHERTQGLSRVYVEGRGTSLLAGVAAGATMLPVDAVDMFAAQPDVFLKVSFSGADGALHLNFTGVVPSAGGSLVGPGATPSSAPILAPAAGASGMEPGVHQYAYTFVTAAGETKPSPIGSIDTRTPVAAATQAPLVIQEPPRPSPPGIYGSNFNIGSSFRFAYAYNKATSQNDLTMLGALSPPSVAQVAISNNDALNPTMSAEMRVGSLYSQDPAVKWINIFVSENGGPFAYGFWLQNYAVVGTAEFSTKGANEPTGGPPHPGAAVIYCVHVSGVAIGPAGTTARKLYRTKANQAALLLNGTIANNTTTVAGVDTLNDASLTTPAPTGDTSGLKAPEGTVNPGVTAVPVAAVQVFAATGGWALAGEQALRYTGVSATDLTGVPASGPGAVVGPIQYNTAIRSAPLLTGIPASGLRSLPIPLSAGDEVYAVVQVDDAARQAQLAADLNVASGIREEWVSDRRLSIPEARARGQATLLSRPLVDATVEYTCRDTKTASGLTLHVDLPAPTNVQGDYKIQSVTWSNFRPRPEQPPTAHVTASSRRFSFEDLLRIVKTKD